jgi:hypothetical protein
LIKLLPLFKHPDGLGSLIGLEKDHLGPFSEGGELRNIPQEPDLSIGTGDGGSISFKETKLYLLLSILLLIPGDLMRVP